MKRKMKAALILSMVTCVFASQGVFSQENEDAYSMDAVLTDVYENDESIIEEVPAEEVPYFQERCPDTADDLIIDPDAIDAGDVSLAPKAEGDIEIDEETFPDAVFRAYVKEKIAGGNDYLTPEDIQKAKKIDVAGMNLLQNCIAAAIS